MKKTSHKTPPTFGKYVVEYRDEKGDLFFYKRTALDTVDSAIDIKNKLEQQGFSDIKIIVKDSLVRLVR